MTTESKVSHFQNTSQFYPNAQDSEVISVAYTNEVQI